MNTRFARFAALGAAAALSLGGIAGASAQGDQTITMIAAGYTPDMQPYFDQLSTAFEAANPGIKVDVQVVSWNDIDQKVSTLVQTQQLPDIVNLNSFAGYAADDLLYTSDQIVTPEVIADIIPAFMDKTQYNGKSYAVPDLASDRLFFYNKDILDKAGVTAPPTTWTELKDAAAKIKATQPDIIPLALPLGPEEAQAEFAEWAGGNGGFYFKDGQWVVNSQENVDTLNFLKSLVDAGYTQPSPATTNRTDGAFPLFAQGKAAMMNGAIFFPGELAKAKSTVNFGTAPTPAADGKSSVTLGVEDYFFGFKKEGNQEAVQKFLSFLYQPDNYAGFLKAAGGFLPATKSAGAAMGSDPALKPFIDVLPSAIFYPSDQASWDATKGAIQTTIGTAVQGADPKSVLDQIQAVATGQ